jgi:hypothetical protein
MSSVYHYSLELKVTHTGLLTEEEGEHQYVPTLACRG